MRSEQIRSRSDAVLWALQLLERRNWVLLDTETTGIHGDVAVVQVGILAPTGRVLLDCLINPCCPIPADATAVHHITDDEVTCCPTWDEVWPVVRQYLAGQTVVVYNADYDRRVIRGCVSRPDGVWRSDMDAPCLQRDTWECAMQAYSAWVGEPGRNGGFRWQRLEGGDHSAIGDCRATLQRIRLMAYASAQAVERMAR